MDTGCALDMRTYKRNRAVLFHKIAPDRFTIHRDGFAKARYEDIPLAKVRKLLKTLLKEEFPRSAKIRLYLLDAYDPEAPRARLKEL